jgi:nucleoside-diphosphate-sugar epimerase
MNKTNYKPNKTLSILGCGWLGMPLAKFLITKGYQIKGSTSSCEKLKLIKEAGILPFKIFLNPEMNEDFDPLFFDSKILVLNFPPQRREDIEEFHSAQVKSLLKRLKNSSVEKVLFISSTSVYADLNRIVSEKDNQMPEKKSGKALRKVEEMLLEEQSFQTTIIRFGGLIGYDRKPGRFLSRTKKEVEGNTPVNLIHQDDCINIILHIIKNNLWGKVYNACCPEHPSRRSFYLEASKIGGFDEPKFAASSSSYKIVSSAKLEATNYNFKFQNPIDALEF